MPYQGFLEKMKWSYPWLARYPLWKAQTFFRRLTEETAGPRHLIIVVANHFEPGWNEQLLPMTLDTQMVRLEHWLDEARVTGSVIRDSDGRPFCHTCFYPAEQYHRPLLEMLEGMEEERLGEVEIHLHHGVREPDTAANLRQALVEFRDLLAEEHRCLSRMYDEGRPMYGFVHGNFALANSKGGSCCGVDDEMQILADTGCYADFTLPAVPQQSQTPKINALYQCGHPLTEAVPHRSGPDLQVGVKPRLPILITGPVVFNWHRRWRGLPLPRIEDGALTASYPLDPGRLRLWSNARIGVRGRPEWSFIKLYCHGFFDEDQPVMIGERIRRFWSEMLEYGERTGDFRIHFVTARESFNLVMAAIDGRSGEPGQYRDYLLRPIRRMQKEVQRVGVADVRRS
jgi:hypothetical protein